MAQGTLQTPNRIRLDLHPAQREIHASNARFRVASTGRRFGKTTLAVGELVVHAARNRGSVLWWVAPVYQQSQIAFKMLLSMLPPSTRVANRSDREVLLWNGSVIAFKSADRPDNLRGEGVSFLVVDEAAYVKAETWQAALRPTLSDTGGRALLASTFFGENYLYDLYQRGQDEEYPEWESWRFPTSANPHIPASEIEEARRTLPHAVFEQEYMANPLVYVGAVFEGAQVQAAIERGALAKYRNELETFAGLDWGYSGETAFEVCQEDVEGRVAWIDERRWVATELNVRCERIAELCAEYGIEMIAADAAGATEIRTLAETLSRHGLKTTIQPMAFGKWKAAAISTRQWYLERGIEAIGPGCKTLGRETKKYRYKEDSKGVMTEDVVKKDDHGIDGTLAFYATRAGRMVRAA